MHMKIAAHFLQIAGAMATSLSSVCLAAEPPTAAQLDSDTRYKKVEHREIKGSCQPASPGLPAMMKKYDGAKSVTSVECSYVAYSLPPDPKAPVAEGSNTGFYALTKPGSNRGLFMRGTWKEDLEATEISFDNEHWFASVKGRCRMYSFGEPGRIHLMCFSVYVDAKGERQGVAVAFDN